MEYTVEMAARGMICIPRFMTVGSGTKVLLRLLPQELQKL
jgi:hypothetical protein